MNTKKSFVHCFKHEEVAVELYSMNMMLYASRVSQHYIELQKDGQWF